MSVPASERPQIFVFGSNLAGRHGKGAALEARRDHGAVYGVGHGPTGRAYAIPTKDKLLRILPLDQIAFYVASFLTYARDHPGLTFNVTRVGCGLAGYGDTDMAPLFADATENVKLPDDWREIAARPARARRNP